MIKKNNTEEINLEKPLMVININKQLSSIQTTIKLSSKKKK